MEPPAIPRLAIAEIADADVPETVALWQRCGLVRPWNDPAADIAFARRGDNSTVLLARTEGILVATVMVEAHPLLFPLWEHGRQDRCGSSRRAPW